MFPSLPLLKAVSQPFKRSQLGLFHGKTKQYGNNVPFSKHKTRRTWLPNVQRKRLFSETLEQDIRVKVTTRAMRTIKKHGGLDNYVAKTRSDLLGLEGMRIRLMVRERAEEKAKHEAEPGDEGQEVSAEVVARAKREALKEVRAFRVERPTVSSAREERMKAAKALGLTTLADARQTIQYLKDRRQELNRILQQ